jgi:hypothetical protein
MGLPDVIPEPTQYEIDAQAVRLRCEGYTFQQIADEMGVSVAAAFKRVRRGYARMPGPKAVEQKRSDLQALADAERMVWQILERPHVVVQNGKVVTVKIREADGTVTERPVPDDAPSLEAIDRLLKIWERRARAEGTDAPGRRSIEVVTKDALMESMERMTAEMAQTEDASYADEGAG